MKTKTVDYNDIKRDLYTELDKKIEISENQFNGIDILKFIFEMGTSIYKSIEKKPMFLYSTGETRCTLANENDTTCFKIIPESSFNRLVQMSNMFNFPSNLLVDYIYRKTGIIFHEMYVYKLLNLTIDAIMNIMNKQDILILRYKRYDGTYLTFKNITPE